MKYNSDVLISNMNIQTVLHMLLFAVHIFQISFFGYTTNHMGSRRSAAHFHMLHLLVAALLVFTARYGENQSIFV